MADPTQDPNQPQPAPIPVPTSDHGPITVVMFATAFAGLGVGIAQRYGLDLTEQMANISTIAAGISYVALQIFRSKA